MHARYVEAFEILRTLTSTYDVKVKVVAEKPICYA